MSDTNAKVKLAIASKGNTAAAVVVDANNISGTSISSMTNATHKVDISVANSIGSLLGFSAVTISSGYNISSN